MRSACAYAVLLCGLLSASSTVAATAWVSDSECEQALEQVSLQSMLSDLLVWEEKTSTWQTARTHPASRTVTLIHIWADWCEPCRNEFPIVRDLIERLPSNVQVISMSQTQDPAALSAFLFKYQANLPKLPIYQGSHLSDTLTGYLARTGLPMPITLILDQKLVVQSVVVGSLAHRRGGILRSIQRLLGQSKGTP